MNNPVPCKGCKTPIIWAKSLKSGSNIPLDFDLKGAPIGINPKGALFALSADHFHCTPIENAPAVLAYLRALEAHGSDTKHVDVIIDAKYMTEQEARELRALPMEGEAGAAIVRRLPVDRIAISHFKTCPQAGRFAKGGRS